MSACSQTQLQSASPKTLIIRAMLLDADLACFKPGELLMENGIITAIGEPDTLPREGTCVLDVDGAMIAPGLIDIHTHGRAGGDFTSADLPTLLRMARSYTEAGVTTVMPTLASAPYDDYAAAAARIHAAASSSDGARFLGLHLEGRYLNPAKRGAHAAALLAPLDANELKQLHDSMCRPYLDNTTSVAPPMRVSAALECDTDGAFRSMAHSLGIALSLGHTSATYEQANALIGDGVHCFTHLFNAMPPLHHRDGGAVAACLGSDIAFGEIICDGFHIAPHMIRLAYSLLGYRRTVLISDSMEGTGCPDGDYSIAGMPVTVKDGKAYTSDGAIAGSTLGLLDAVRNLMCFCDIPAAHALLCATRNPARAAGIDHLLGELKVGLAADILVLRGDNLTMEHMFIGGNRIGGVCV